MDPFSSSSPTHAMNSSADDLPLPASADGAGQPPPLHFDTVDINGSAVDDEDDNDIFESAVQQIHSIPYDPSLEASVQQQPQSQLQQHLSNPSSAIMEEVLTTDGHQRNGSTASDYYIDITVSEPQKSGAGSYIMYKVTTKTSLPKFSKTHFTTMRRFSDFLGLHDLLVSKYLRFGRIIPPAPSKNLFGTTRAKMPGGTSHNGSTVSLASAGSGAAPTAATIGDGMEWLENRRAALERFVGRIAQHPVLVNDADFVNFLQSDEELPKAVNTAALSGAGVMRLFNKVGETVNKITYKMDENDAWFEEKVNEVENLDLHLQKLHAAIKALVTHRRELSVLTGSVAKSAAMLSTCEEHAGLSRALSQLADVEEKVELLRSEQANSDLYILSETLKDYVGLFGAIKDVFHERVKVFQNWQHAQLQLTKRREAVEKLRLANRNDKLEQAQREVEEWEAKVQRCQQEFDEISVEIKREIERFEMNRIRDFKATIVKYLQDQMAHQQQLIKYWKTFIRAQETE